MSVTIKQYKAPEVEYGDVCVGDAFYCNGALMMKLSENQAWNFPKKCGEQMITNGPVTPVDITITATYPE